jgi:hypothetical protein
MAAMAAPKVLSMTTHSRSATTKAAPAHRYGPYPCAFASTSTEVTSSRAKKAAACSFGPLRR